MKSPAIAKSVLGATLIALACAFCAVPAQAKEAIDFFGGPGTRGGQFSSGVNAVAVNDSGVGPANAGDVYVRDPQQNRIQRFGRDDGGTPGTTPADTADDTYLFISAWGADVVQNGGTGDQGDAGDANFEICTVSSQCKPGVASGGNGNPVGNGALGLASFLRGGIALDQDTGDLYVSDPGNNRVNVYSGDGAFLRSFGWDVNATTPGTGFEVCPAADVCKAGVPGSGLGQLGADAEGIVVSQPDGNPASGTVFLADAANHRVNTYDLDGGGPASIGSAAEFDGPSDPAALAVDSRGILYVAADGNNGFDVERYDTENANGGGVGFLAPIPLGVNERQEVTVDATAGTFNLSFDPDGPGPKPAETTEDLPFDAPGRLGSIGDTTPGTVQGALVALPSVGRAAVVNPSNGGPYTIRFENGLGASDVAEFTCADGATPLSGGAGCSVATTVPGQFGLTIDSLYASLAVDPDTDGAGPDADVLYSGRSNGTDDPIQQFGPVNAPGLTLPPVGEDDRHKRFRTFFDVGGLAVEPTTGRLYAAGVSDIGTGVFVLDESSPTLPAVSLDSCDSITATSADCHATIDPNGPPVTRYHFEYVEDAAYQQDGFQDAFSTPEVVLGAQEDPQAVSETISAPAVGLAPSTVYHVRVVAGRRFDTPVVSGELGFTTEADLPQAETTGAPHRSTTALELLGRVDPRNSDTDYHFEHGTQGPCSANPCQSTPVHAAGSDNEFHLVAERIEGLQPNTAYHYRLVADNGAPGSPVYGADMTVTTRASEDPLDHGGFQRLTVRAGEGTFNLSFDGDTTPDLPYDATADSVRAALGALPSIGSGNVGVTGGPGDRLGRNPYAIVFTGPFSGQSVPRLVAQSGTPPLARQPGDVPGDAEIAVLPGPPQSDRAYEQVSLADSSGNPVTVVNGLSEGADRVLYQLGGGTSFSEYGTSLGSLYFAERNEPNAHEGAWQPRTITPPRSESLGSIFSAVDASSDLSAVLATNFSVPTTAVGNWLLSPEAEPSKLFETTETNITNRVGMTISADGSLAVAVDQGGLDPLYPQAEGKSHLYEIGSGTPRLLSLMPDGSVPSCGTVSGGVEGGLFSRPPRRANWVAPDGSRVFFGSQGHCNGGAQLYMRDVAAETTTSISGTGPCGAALIKATPDAAFFWTQSDLVSEDSSPSGCGLTSPILDGDVYRYDIEDENLDCVTCLFAGLDADVPITAPSGSTDTRAIAVAEDGSRVYFSSRARLLRGAPPSATYRLDVAGGDLAYVGPVAIGEDPLGSSAISGDGSVIVFRSSDPGLNPIGGGDNGGTAQYYRYDDEDRSLVCISCPPDGSQASIAAASSLLTQAIGPNATPLSADGSTIAFGTPAPLLATDQNTPAPSEDPRIGSDLYEWRDGRLLLITDGLLSWPFKPGPSGGQVKPPLLRGMSQTGSDVFFTVAARYTSDAVDGFVRLYDARIGGGFDVPPPPPPCSLEDCQGPPSPLPTDPASGSSTQTGAGNQGVDRSPACKKGKRLRGGKCVKKRTKPKKRKGKNRRGGGR